MSMSCSMVIGRAGAVCAPRGAAAAPASAASARTVSGFIVLNLHYSGGARSNIAPDMSPDTERRTQRDRRRTTRGGRRPGDPTGYDPLILVADEDASNGARCVAILAKLRFAVAPAHTVEEAVKAMEALRP